MTLASLQFLQVFQLWKAIESSHQIATMAAILTMHLFVGYSIWKESRHVDIYALKNKRCLTPTYYNYISLCICWSVVFYDPYNMSLHKYACKFFLKLKYSWLTVSMLSFIIINLGSICFPKDLLLLLIWFSVMRTNWQIGYSGILDGYDEVCSTCYFKKDWRWDCRKWTLSISKSLWLIKCKT